MGSRMGSRYRLTTSYATLSRTVGIPSVRVRPSPLGRSTRRTGRGKWLPEDIRFQPRWFGEPIKSEYLTDRLGANPDGVLAEYGVFNEEAVVALPSHLSFEGAATLPCAAVTAGSH